MFRTIFSVTLYKSESTIFRAYFDDSAAAKKYAENLTKKTADEYVFVSQKDIDGSFILIWKGDLTTITLDDNAWITDHETSGIRFYNNEGIPTTFKSYDAFNEFIVHSQEKYNS